MVGDLTDNNDPLGVASVYISSVPTDLKAVPKQYRYKPWSSSSGLTAIYGDVEGANQIAYRDGLYSYSQASPFPAGTFPNVGWLGRVHRGTPWQTVYLKSATNNNTTWVNWTGDRLGNYFGANYPIDSMISQPTNDWLLMDLFTTSPNENASRGQLSVNQTNTAAWAAVLDGVCALSNSATGPVPWFIDPADRFLYTDPVSGTKYFTNSVQYIASSINAQRMLTNFLVNPPQPVYPGGVFTSAGQILSVPQLTVASPYITNGGVNTNFLSDAVMERIPQQIMSLLRLGSPKYVIFAYGQALKPAEHSIVQSGPFFGMCTNYQITGEVATRTVVRFDNPPIPGKPATAPRAVVEAFNVLAPE
jgi:hypothetical protein